FALLCPKGSLSRSAGFGISENANRGPSRRGFSFENDRRALQPWDRSLHANLACLFQALHQSHAQTVQCSAFLAFSRHMTAGVAVTYANQPPRAFHAERNQV